MNATEKRLYKEAIKALAEKDLLFDERAEYEKGIEDADRRQRFFELYTQPAARALCAQSELVCQLFCVSDEKLQLDIAKARAEL